MSLLIYWLAVFMNMVGIWHYGKMGRTTRNSVYKDYYWFWWGNFCTTGFALGSVGTRYLFFGSFL